MATIPFRHGDPIPPLCTQCRHFRPPTRPNVALRYGTCSKYGRMHLVDGSVDHEYASTARQSMCKGFDFEAIPRPERAP